MLEDQGGWTNPQIADWFEAYADLCFASFGEDVNWTLMFYENLVANLIYIFKIHLG